MKPVLIIAAAGIGSAALVYLLLTAIASSRRAGTLLPGEVPVTAVPGVGGNGNTPAGPNALDPATGLPRPIGPCRGIMRWSWHLRPREQLGTEGATPYPASTEVTILRAATLTRNGALMYRVRVVRDGAEGYAFVQPYELVGDCRPAGTVAPA
jgi:hypothetical protein